MKLGIYGGSFDPIHRGHIDPLLEARDQLGLDQVIYLPTARPPHKKERRLASAQARFAMVEMALLDYPDLRVSSFEMGLDGPSYTIQTLEHFQAAGVRLHLVLGADSYLQLHQWFRFEDIVRLARLVVLTRPRVAAESSEPLNNPHIRPAQPPAFVANRAVAASSTEIRRALAAGEPIPRSWLPGSVLKYIEKYGLYRPASPAKAEETS